MTSKANQPVSNTTNPNNTHTNNNNNNDNSTQNLISKALRNHLKSIGIFGECSDIRLKCFGNLYSLHRLLLIQSGFFNSMLLSGFKEGLDLDDAAANRNRNGNGNGGNGNGNGNGRRGSKGLGKGKGKGKGKSVENEERDDSDVIELHFDDPQITRPAFEYAIAHLYGAAPELVLPIWASPSAEEPLSPLFGSPKPTTFQNNQDLPLNPSDSDSSIDEISNSSQQEQQQQPATPRFLCSLIATSTYLGLPALTSQALTLILCSITPFTVKHYLHFAIGRGISGASEIRLRQSEMIPKTTDNGNGELWDWELEGPIRGLESFGKPDTFSSSNFQTESFYASSSQEEEGEEEGEGENSDGSDHGRTGSTTPSATGNQSLDLGMEDFSRKRARGESSPTKPSSHSASKKNRFKEPSNFRNTSNRAIYLYGSVGEKIGEASSCWLSRWGKEVFEVEEIVSRGQNGYVLPISEKVGHFFYEDGVLPSFASVMANPPPLSVWSRGSIPSSWVRAIISSDSFFIQDEWERYVFATRVVDLRRAQKVHSLNVKGLQLGEEEEHEPVESDEDDHSPVGLRSNSRFSSSAYNKSNSQKKSAGASSNKSKDGKGSKKFRDLEEEIEDEGDVSGSDSEEEYSQLFSEGIYYTHMDFNRLDQISGLGYAPQSVLHSALWRNSALQASIKASETAALKVSTQTLTISTETNEPTEAEISASSLSQSLSLLDFVKAQEISSRGRSSTPLTALGNLNLGNNNMKNSTPVPDLSRRYYPVPVGNNNNNSTPIPDLSRRYYPVPVDDTLRLGDSLSSLSINSSNPTEESLRESSGATGVAALVDSNTLSLPPPLNRLTQSSPMAGAPLIETSVKGFFGLDNWARTGHEVANRGNKIAEQPLEESFSSSSLNETYIPSSSSPQSSSEIDVEVEKQSSSEDFEESSENNENDDRVDEGIHEDVEEGEEEEENEEIQEDEVEDENQEREEETIPNRTATTTTTTAAAASSIPSHLRTNDRTSGTPPPGQTHESSSTPSKKKGMNPSSGTSSLPPSISPLLTKEHWTGFEPMRASFEFFGVDKLPEKQRLYSPTFHFAGSLWNVYVQTLKKPKGLQLGVYLHRQNPLDTLPHFSIPSVQTSPSSNNDNQTNNSGSKKTATVIASSSGIGIGSSISGNSSFYTDNQSHTDSLGFPSNYTSSSTTTTDSISNNDSNQIGASYNGPGGSKSYSLLSPTSTSNSTVNQQPNLKPAEWPNVPYTDSRRMLKASFSIHCPSPLGTALTRFSSAPDQFTLSQSWGWKSSSLLGTTYLKDGVLGSIKNEPAGRFRCCCVIGLV